MHCVYLRERRRRRCRRCRIYVNCKHKHASKIFMYFYTLDGEEINAAAAQKQGKIKMNKRIKCARLLRPPRSILSFGIFVTAVVAATVPHTKTRKQKKRRRRKMQLFSMLSLSVSILQFFGFVVFFSVRWVAITQFIAVAMCARAILFFFVLFFCYTPLCCAHPTLNDFTFFLSHISPSRAQFFGL